MEDNNYIYVITALLPLAAGMVVFEVNPYHALVIRGILGAVAALVYAILGAADVALTEALVGTMLAITLYAVAVRSSLVMRVGVLQDELTEEPSLTPLSKERQEEPPLTSPSKGGEPESFLTSPSKEGEDEPPLTSSLKEGEDDRALDKLIQEFRRIFRQYYMRVELVPYKDTEDLHRALMEKEVHATCSPPEKLNPPEAADQTEESDGLPVAAKVETPAYQTNIRLQRLYEIMHNELASSQTSLIYINPADSGEKH